MSELYVLLKMKIDYTHNDESIKTCKLEPLKAVVSFGDVDLEVKASWIRKPLDTLVQRVSYPDAFHGAVYFDEIKELNMVSFSLKLTQGDREYYLNNCQLVKPDEDMLSIDSNLTWGVEFGFTTEDLPYPDPFS